MCECGQIIPGTGRKPNVAHKTQMVVRNWNPNLALHQPFVVGLRIYFKINVCTQQKRGIQETWEYALEAEAKIYIHIAYTCRCRLLHR